MGGNVNFRDYVEEHSFCLKLQIDELMLGIHSIGSSESRKKVAFESECPRSLLPIVVEILLKAVIVEVKLQGIEFVIGHHLNKIFEITCRYILPATVEDQSTNRICRSIKGRSTGNVAAMMLFTQLQQRVKYEVSVAQKAPLEVTAVTYA